MHFTCSNLSLNTTYPLQSENQVPVICQLIKKGDHQFGGRLFVTDQYPTPQSS